VRGEGDETVEKLSEGEDSWGELVERLWVIGGWNGGVQCRRAALDGKQTPEWTTYKMEIRTEQHDRKNETN
jgi:hypothetical protein